MIIRNEVKLRMLDIKWQQKKTEIQRPKKELTPEQSLIKNFQEQAEQEQENRATAALYSKLKSGGKLSPEEIAYLEKKDPEALRKYREALAEKAAYKEELRNCKTKEDVDKVKLNKLGMFAAEAKNVANSPYIPEAKKVQMMGELLNRISLVQEAHVEFVSSAEYQNLPTEEEILEENRENRENMEESRLEPSTEESDDTGETEASEISTEISTEEADVNTSDSQDEGNEKNVVKSEEEVEFTALKEKVQSVAVEIGTKKNTINVGV